MIEEEEDGDTENYWFFVNKWFAKGEGDKLTVRELVPTDENGQPLKGALDGNVFFFIYATFIMLDKKGIFFFHFLLCS